MPVPHPPGPPLASDSGFSAASARVVLGAVILGPLMMFSWYLWAGVSWTWAAGATVLFLCIVIVTTRLIAEAGLVLLGTGAGPLDSALGLATGARVDPAGLSLLGVQKGALMEDYRQSLMPYLSNGLKTGALAGFRPGKLLPWLALAAGLGFFASGLGTLGTSYRYGAANISDWSAKAGPGLFLGRAAAAVKGEQAPPPALANASHAGIGLAGASLLLYLRSRWVWWPLHPYGWVICTTYATWMIWFSVFLGWLAKSLVMALGGPGAYRRLVPGFIGLVLGESLIGAFWALLSLATGTPGIRILP